MLRKYAIINKALFKIIGIILLSALIVGFGWGILHKEVLRTNSEADQALLQLEQGLLDASIGNVNDDLLSTKFMIEKIQRSHARTTSNNNFNANDKRLLELEQTLENQQRILTYYQEIFTNNQGLLEHYFQDNRLSYEIKRSELLLTNMDKIVQEGSIEQYQLQTDLNYIFRRTSKEEIRDELPFLLTSQKANQNPYPSLDGYMGWICWFAFYNLLSAILFLS